MKAAERQHAALVAAIERQQQMLAALRAAERFLAGSALLLADVRAAIKACESSSDNPK